MKRLKLNRRTPAVLHFDDKARVYDVTFPQTRGVVVKAGEQISEVKWERDTPWGKQSFVQNKYLRPASIKPATVE